MTPLALLALTFVATPVLALLALGILVLKFAVKRKVAAAIAAALLFLFGTTAYPGRGSKLATSSTNSNYVNVAQLQKFAFAGMSAAFEDITNLDSPSIFKEWMKTIVDAKDVSFTGVLDPSNPAGVQGLLTQLQTSGATSLYYWQITLTNGSVLTFQGYVSELMPVSVEYSKALVYSGKIMIVGAVTAAW